VQPRAIGKEALVGLDDVLEYCCYGREYYCYVGRLSFKYCCNGGVYKAFWQRIETNQSLISGNMEVIRNETQSNIDGVRETLGRRL